MTNERTAKSIATFSVPAVVNTTDFRKDWQHNSYRVVVTDQADPFMVRYLTGIVRS